MNANTHTLRVGRASGPALGLGALLVTVGCATRDTGLSAQPLAATMGADWCPDTCELRAASGALVRQVVINGAAVSQVECVSVGQLPLAQPVANAACLPSGQRGAAGMRAVWRRVRRARGDDAVRAAGADTPVIYDEDVRPARQTRSVKKSAIIIGSSAGVGAGVGAAVGGKKGALIGAAIGGGSAAIWDQVTRR
jgi:hypothetical protein